MAEATTIREFKTAGGKTKYQAQVWHKGVFYTAKTFDLRPLAVAFKEDALKRVVKGELLSATARKAVRTANALLEKPMTYWAEKYITTHGQKHGQARISEYRTVGNLLAKQTLMDFDGKSGAQLIERLARDWRHERIPRSDTSAAAEAAKAKPLADNTLRLRLSALVRVIRFAKSALPANATFQPPDMESLFEFTLPPAHGNPRKLEVSDDEYVRLLRHVGPDSAFGQYLRVIDETGCRLGEVLSAHGSAIHIYMHAGQVIGGHLTLTKHKTSNHVGTREVPLSLFAAQVLHARKLRFGDGAVFQDLGSNNKMCKVFDANCQELGMRPLQIKDLRRGFINRNKYLVAHVDMVHIVGQTTLLDKSTVTDSEKSLLDAVGHTNIKTTAGYSTPHLEKLARVFTQSSRWPQIAALLQPSVEPSGSDQAANIQHLQQQLTDILEQLALAGATAPCSSEHGVAAPSSATGLQPVAQGETVKADASTVENIGPVPLWSLGRHGTLRAGRPHPRVNTAPSPADPATAASTGGQPARRVPLKPLFAVSAGAS